MSDSTVVVLVAGFVCSLIVIMGRRIRAKWKDKEFVIGDDA